MTHVHITTYDVSFCSSPQPHLSQVRVDSAQEVSGVRSEALYFGISSLVTKIDLCSDRSGCGGLLFLSKLPSVESSAPPPDGSPHGV
jgi:hypothetical protein